MKNKYFILLALVVSFLSNAQKVAFHDTFDSDKNQWALNNNNLVTSVENGMLVMKNNDKQNSKWELISVINSPDEVDYDVEATLKVTQTLAENSAYGLVWSCYNDYSDYRVVNMTPNKQVQVYQYSGKEFYYLKKWEETQAINGKNKFNKIHVKKRANRIEVYINDKLIVKSGDFMYSGSKAGFILDAGMTIEIDELKVTEFPKNIEVIDTYDANLILKKIESISSKEYDEVNPVLSADGNTIYVAKKSSPENLGGVNDDDIWFATKDAKGNWSTLRNMGKPLNNTSYNFVISVSPDNNSMVVANTYNADGSSKGSGLSIANRTINGWEVPKEVLIKDYENKNQFVGYFQSNDNKVLLMAIEKGSGFGYKDLYVSFIQEDGTWSSPLNLGATVNTFDEETNPFLGSDGKTLYFSSKGHLGYGSYDLFVTKRLDDTWTNWSKPKNLGNKINSVDSDLAYYVSAKGDKAYISKAGDIYEVDNKVKQDPVVLIKGKVYDNKTKQILSAKIEYNNLKTNKNAGTAISNPKDGSYSIVLPYGQKYSFMGNKEGYYAVTENIDLTNLKEYQEMEVDLYLSPIEKGEVIRLNNIFFDSGKYDLLPDSYAELDKLYQILMQNSKMKIEISGHTDAVGSDVDNMNLSNNRANAVMQYLLKKGVNGNRLTAKGYGETKFIAPNDTEKGKQKNRRVEFVIVEL